MHAVLLLLLLLLQAFSRICICTCTPVCHPAAAVVANWL
jgi:hypothetical protein